MTSWKALFFKEFKASKMWSFLNATLILLGGVCFNLFDNASVVLHSLMFIIVFHVVYLPIWVVYSLFVEWKERAITHWYSLPHQGIILLTSKFAAGVAMMLLSLLTPSIVLTLLYTFFLGDTDPMIERGSLWFIHNFWGVLLGIGVMAIYAGSQVLCAIFIGASATRCKPLWIIGFLLLPGLVQMWLRDSALYEAVTRWGMFTSPSQNWLDPLFPYENEVFKSATILSEVTTFSIGIVGPQLVISLFLIWISSKLLDRYVQI
ncbi:hypothetical protein [Paenibacillus sp. Marseille-Q4541]|uniref:hypothetical protein n=1 Tax=Paenibacillus sp. Marseille-Q4541 TaxID=2831522 RepID=UPI001BABED92|nr:hypothetical protein [Paenibacillus sp. Marseille-Q4541]